MADSGPSLASRYVLRGMDGSEVLVIDSMNREITIAPNVKMNYAADTVFNWVRHHIKDDPASAEKIAVLEAKLIAERTQAAKMLQQAMYEKRTLLAEIDRLRSVIKRLQPPNAPPDPAVDFNHLYRRSGVRT